jgi:hypothetical protein
MIVIKRNSHMNHKFPAQNGYAMFGIIAVLGVTTTAVVVTSLSVAAVHNEQNRRTSSALALAKQALIASAASSATHPGGLPCPDINNDGQPDITQAGTCAATVGRLPWQSLGLPDLRDGAGERLWYAMSENFQDISANRINPTGEGRLNAIGVTNTHDVVAIVFAPGPAVGNQARDASNTNIADNYIESYASDSRTVNLRAPDSTYNDQILLISPVDIFTLAEKRVAKEVQ